MRSALIVLGIVSHASYVSHTIAGLADGLDYRVINQTKFVHIT